MEGNYISAECAVLFEPTFLNVNPIAKTTPVHRKSSMGKGASDMETCRIVIAPRS